MDSVHPAERERIDRLRRDAGPLGSAACMLDHAVQSNWEGVTLTHAEAVAVLSILRPAPEAEGERELVIATARRIVDQARSSAERLGAFDLDPANGKRATPAIECLAALLEIVERPARAPTEREAEEEREREQWRAAEYVKMCERIANAYVELFPNYTWDGDPWHAVDLMRAEILTTRKERDALRAPTEREPAADEHGAG